MYLKQQGTASNWQGYYDIFLFDGENFSFTLEYRWCISVGMLLPWVKTAFCWSHCQMQEKLGRFLVRKIIFSCSFRKFLFPIERSRNVSRRNELKFYFRKIHEQLLVLSIWIVLLRTMELLVDNVKPILKCLTDDRVKLGLVIHKVLCKFTN